jgi:hypothetical protein
MDGEPMINEAGKRDVKNGKAGIRFFTDGQA